MNSEEKKRFVRYKSGAVLYDVCQSTFEKWAKEAGAVCKIGKVVLVDCYFLKNFSPSSSLFRQSHVLTPCSAWPVGRSRSKDTA